MGCKFSKVRENIKNHEPTFNINNISHFDEHYELDIKDCENESCKDILENGKDGKGAYEKRESTTQKNATTIINRKKQKRKKICNHKKKIGEHKTSSSGHITEEREKNEYALNDKCPEGKNSTVVNKKNAHVAITTTNNNKLDSKNSSSNNNNKDGDLKKIRNNPGSKKKNVDSNGQGNSKVISRLSQRNVCNTEHKEMCKSKIETILSQTKKKNNIADENNVRSSLWSARSSSRMLAKESLVSVYAKKKIKNSSLQMNKGSDFLMYYHDFKNPKLKKNNFMYIYEFYKNNDSVFNHLSMMPSYIALNAKQSQIIFESSVIGKYVMFPWVENDPDIKNNLYLKYVLHYFHKKKHPEKMNEYHIGNTSSYVCSIYTENEQELEDEEKCYKQEKKEETTPYTYNSSYALNSEPSHACKTDKDIINRKNEAKRKKGKKSKVYTGDHFTKKKGFHLKKKGSLILSVDKILINCNTSSSINTYRRCSSSLTGMNLGFSWYKSGQWNNVPKRTSPSKDKEGRRKSTVKEKKEDCKEDKKTDSTAALEKKTQTKTKTKIKTKNKNKTKNKTKIKKEQVKANVEIHEDDQIKRRSKSKDIMYSVINWDSTPESSQNKKVLRYSTDQSSSLKEKKKRKRGGEVSLSKKTKKFSISNIDSKYFDKMVVGDVSVKWRKPSTHRERKSGEENTRTKRSLIKPPYLLKENVEDKNYKERRSPSMGKTEIRTFKIEDEEVKKQKEQSRKRNSMEKKQNKKENEQNKKENEHNKRENRHNKKENEHNKKENEHNKKENEQNKRENKHNNKENKQNNKENKQNNKENKQNNKENEQNKKEKEQNKKEKEQNKKEKEQNKKENELNKKMGAENNTYGSLMLTSVQHTLQKDDNSCEMEKKRKIEIMDVMDQHHKFYNGSYKANSVNYQKDKNITGDVYMIKKKKEKGNSCGSCVKNGDTDLENAKGNTETDMKECSHLYKLSDNCLKRNFVSCEKCTKKRCVFHYLNNYKLYGWLNYKWTDPDGFLDLSKRQQRKFFAWKRLSDLYSNPIVMTSTLCSNCIRQGFVADCSFLSSLTVLIEYERKHKIHVLSNIISPYASNYVHSNKLWPVYNPSGMYICRLHCNGVQRKIIIDDFVPVKNNDSLLVAYSNNQQELWVTLLEKAFVKLMGGSYSMFGSNPGSDLYYLTGWIPVTISFKSKVSSSPPSIERSVVHSRNAECLQRKRRKYRQVFVSERKEGKILHRKKKKAPSNIRYEKTRSLNKKAKIYGSVQNKCMYQKRELNLDCYRMLRNVNWVHMNCSACKKYEKWKLLLSHTKRVKKIVQSRNVFFKPVNKKRRDWEIALNTKKQFLNELNCAMDYSSYVYNSKYGSKSNSVGNSNNSTISNKMENNGVTEEVEGWHYDKKWDAIWNNIYDGIKKGKCVVCLGTLELEDAAPSGLDYPEGVSISTGIVTRHAYSILNIETYKSDKLLYVKNPWGCIRWKGKYSYQDENTWTKELQKKLNYSLDKAKSKDDGCFWIQWKDVVKHFSHIYICWNSSIFPYHVEIHTKWENNVLLKSSILLDDTHLVAYNPQFALHINVKKQDLSEDGLYYIGKKPIEVWILLSRHVKERKTDVSQKYLALHVHAGKNRITCPLFPIKQGVYSNGECTFTKLVIGAAEEDNFDYGLERRDSNLQSQECVESSKYGRNGGSAQISSESFGDLVHKGSGLLSQMSETEILRNIDFVLIVSQYSQKEEFNFTLKAFSHTSLSLYELPPLLWDKFESTYFKGKWTSKCAGGCSNNLWSYFKNPHIRLFVPEESAFTIFLECAQEHSVNLRIFKGMTSSPRTLKKGEVISSGAYRAGCCFIECTLESGIYSLIPSLYKANTTGTYQICIHHSKLKKKPILYFIPYPYVLPPLSFFNYHVSHLHSPRNYSLIFFRVSSVTLVSVRVIFFQNVDMKGIPLINIYKLIENESDKSAETNSSLKKNSRKENDMMINDVKSGRLIHNNAFTPTINYKGNVYELVEKCNIHGSTNNNILPISSCAYDYYVKFNSVFISLVELEKTTSYMLLITTNLVEDVINSHEAHFISDKRIHVDKIYPSN